MADVHTKMDNDLARQVKRAGSTRPLEAVFMLSEDISTPQQTVEAARRLVEKAGNRAGSRGRLLTIFENLGSFLVSGNSTFIEAMLAEPEAKSAMANHQSEDVMIRPI